LYGFDQNLISGGVLASVAKILIATETAVGGPYRTWLVAPDADEHWRDVDVVVNANVGNFLKKLNVRVSGVYAFIGRVVRERKLTSPYYSEIFPIAYSVARFYGRGDSSNTIAKLLLELRGRNGLWRNPLSSALAICALIESDHEEKISLEDISLLMAEIKRSDWQPYAFCIDPARGGKRHYAGASALTAAVVLEAVARFYASSHDKSSGDTIPVAAEDIHARVQSIACNRSRCLPLSLRNAIVEQVEKTTDKNITRLPYLFRDLLGSRSVVVSDSLLAQLALGNLYGWMAYEIYDDIYDEEGDASSFPAANYFLRELCDVYASIDRQIPGASASSKIFLDEMDNANIMEQKYCRVAVADGTMRIPDNLPVLERGTVLSERSIGHALPVLVLCASIGFAFDSPENKTILYFFRHYLVARQLHDDAHDWRQDLKKGQINAVGAMMLRAWRKKNHADEIDFARDERQLALFFWHDVIDDVVAAIHGHIVLARRTLASVSIIYNPHSIIRNMAPLEDLLSNLESAADRARAERKTIEQFMAGFQRPKGPSQ